jgi:hypothetical protein
MEKIRDWKHYRDMWIRVLEKQTGKGLSHWNKRIKKEKFSNTRSLEAWLIQQGVTGYAQQLLVMERFGYPDFRPIYEAIVAAARDFDEFVIQARKTYVSLVTPRRTFARVQATTKNRVDLGFRLEGKKPGGRLRPSRFHETMKLQISFTTPDEVDAEALGWLKKAYEQNS